MAVAPTTSTSGRSLSELRRARRVLRAERARIAQWRRLVRARLDLAIAIAAQPEALGQDPDVLPGDVESDLPAHTELVAQVLGGGPSIEVDRLEALRQIDQQLARYAASVAESLDAATTEFIRRVAADPTEMFRGLGGEPADGPGGEPSDRLGDVPESGPSTT